MRIYFKKKIGKAINLCKHGHHMNYKNFTMKPIYKETKPQQKKRYNF